ncbi:MAG: hypothetical protein M3395_00560 [Chloroflexota bacterium]|nr:hypothetical protein [Chloroflexota bacterium]
MTTAGARAIHALPARVVSEATGADRRTVERWRRGTPPRQHVYVGRLDDLAAVLEILGTLNEPAKQAWLVSRSAFLGWERPIDLISVGEFDRVRGAALAYVGGDNT